MKKDFQKWHKEKTIIQNDKERPHFHVREVWFCSVGANVGFEQDGGEERYLRPVIIIRKFNNEVLWALPCTKNVKKGIYYYRLEIGNQGQESTTILSQLRLIDAKRLQYNIGNISEKDFKELKKRLRALLE